MRATEGFVRKGVSRDMLLQGLSDPGSLTGVRLPPLVLAYMACVLLPVAFNLGPLYMTLLRLFLFLTIIPLMVGLFTGKMGKIRITDILFLAHLGWAFVALMHNNRDVVVQNIGAAFVELMGGYLLARRYIRTAADFSAFAKLLGMVIIIMLPLSLYETVTSNPVIIRLVKALPGLQSFTDTREIRLGLFRVQGVFANPIHFGLFCSTAVSLTFVSLKNVIPSPRRWVITIGVCISTFLSLSSGAFLPMVLHIFMILWYQCLRGTGRPWTLLLILLVIMYVVIDLTSNRTPMRVFLSYATFSAHTAYWRSIIFDWGMINVWKNPIYGIGLNDWERPSFMYSGSMDNFWLVMAVRYGIPGFLTIAAGWLIAIWRIGRRDFSGDPQLAQMRRGWMFTMVGLSLTMCTVHLWTTIYSYVFMLFGAGAWFLDAQPRGALVPTGEAIGNRHRAGGVDHRVVVEEPPVVTTARGGKPVLTRFPQTHRRILEKAGQPRTKDRPS